MHKLIDISHRSDGRMKELLTIFFSEYFSDFLWQVSSYKKVVFYEKRPPTYSSVALAAIFDLPLLTNFL